MMLAKIYHEDTTFLIQEYPIDLSIQWKYILSIPLHSGTESIVVEGPQHPPLVPD